MSHNNQKKIASINDISGFGRCSATVSIPIISHMKIQCCPVITSIFSNHTGYENYFFDDYTDKMQAYIDRWKLLDLKFEGIYTGFLGSCRQIDIVKKFIRDFRTKGTIIIVDPVMGDDGKAYTTYTTEMCGQMKSLVSMAEIVTPNVTEACILTGTAYKESGWSNRELKDMAEKIAASGPKKVVITGIRSRSYVGNFIYETEGGTKLLRTQTAGAARCGTGDVFSSIISADAVNGTEFEASVRKAAGFIKECIQLSVQNSIPEEDGVCFEEILHRLK